MKNLVEEKEMRMAFYQLEKFYRPLFDLLTENQDLYPKYKGGLTIDSYLCYQPDVLILGYNPRHGKYHDWQKEGAHLVYTGERPFGAFEYGNANKNGKWYELSLPHKNSYPRNIVEFVFQLAEEQKRENLNAKNQRPSWANFVESKIMKMNLYPFGTKDEAAMRSLFSQVISSKRTLYQKPFNNEWALRKYLLDELHHFIDEKVRPKSILCLGKATISDYCGMISKSQYEGVYVSKKYPNVIGVSRSGTWTSRVKNAAKLINEIINRN